MAQVGLVVFWCYLFFFRDTGTRASATDGEKGGGRERAIALPIRIVTSEMSVHRLSDCGVALIVKGRRKKGKGVIEAD